MQLIKRVHEVVEHTDIEKHRQSQDYFGALLGTNKETEITPVSIHGMEGEWITADRARMKKYVILYCHGGGYSTGSCLYARTLTTKLAAVTSMDVLAFDYRLAPEHPYPAALEDALKAWDYLMLLGYGAKEVILAGDSAGGNLALSLALRLKQENRRLPGGLVLLSPWTDMLATGRSYLTKAEIDPILNIAYLRQMTDNYAFGEDLKNPLISPLYGDFTGFPPVYIQVGENEVLLSDATALHKLLLKKGVKSSLEIYKGMWHVFQMSPSKKAYNAIEKCAEFMFEVYR
ncbi:MAG: alpha/beta hydrolase [Lachnospiraceae bacterium]|nr:alpha/beta hydrolase [Lachnospiraceae bacterium]